MNILTCGHKRAQTRDVIVLGFRFTYKLLDSFNLKISVRMKAFDSSCPSLKCTHFHLFLASSLLTFQVLSGESSYCLTGHQRTKLHNANYHANKAIYSQEDSILQEVLYAILLLLKCKHSYTMSVTLQIAADNNGSYSTRRMGRATLTSSLSLGISRSDPFQQPASAGAAGKLNYIY